jgi:hypothetical protein
MLGSGSWDAVGRHTRKVSSRADICAGSSMRNRFCFAQKDLRRFCSISGINNANHQSTGSQRPRFGNSEEQEPGFAGLPPASRRVHSRVHHDAEEAELGTS